MNINDLKRTLEEIVHDYMYVSSTLSDIQLKQLQDISDFLDDDDDTSGSLRTLLSTRNNENYYFYNKFIKIILNKLTKGKKMDILINQDKYEEIVNDNIVYKDIWDSLNKDEKIHYLKNKKKFSEIDIYLINSVMNDNKLRFLEAVVKDEEIRNKIELNTISLDYNSKLLEVIDLSDFNVCRIFTKETYTKYISKKYKNFDDFYNLYLANKKIYSLLKNNGLSFNDKDNEKIYKFILENNNFIGKLNTKYLSLFSILEITKFSNNKELDGDAFATLIQQLYKYNKEDADQYFCEENLRKCPIHSLNVNPFEHMSKELREKIFSDYNLFNRFIDTIMIESINNHFAEEDIVNILRNDVFVLDSSSYAIELLLNKLSFKSAFNMLQRKCIFDKINHLNSKIEEKDLIFIKGFLDSPVLVLKSEHIMLSEMLSLLDSEELLYYITLPYIINNINNSEIISLCLTKEVKINKIVNCQALMEKLNINDVITFIDKSWENELDLSIFQDRNLASLLFNINEEKIKDINFDEVNYLFETIRMKALLSKQNCECNIASYKTVLISYLVMGLDLTLKIVAKGNEGITLKQVKKLQKNIVDEMVLQFKENNSSIFQNMAKKIISNLNVLEKTNDVNQFAKKVANNTYLDNVMYLMLDNNYDSYNNIIKNFFGFVNYQELNKFEARKEIYDYANDFISLYINSKRTKYTSDFDKIILKNFKPKEKVIYAKRKELARNYLRKLKLKLFIRALTEPNKDSYKIYFKDNFSLDNIENKFIKYLDTEEVEFNNILEHVLIPFSNDRFDEINCLEQIGIKKPDNYEIYFKYKNEFKNVTILNHEIDKLKDSFEFDQIIMIMNYICYGTSITFNLKKKTLSKINELKAIVDDISTEIYIDKMAMKFIYNNDLDVYNLDELIEYMNYIDILNKIINKTFNYINRHMINEKVINAYSSKYYAAINSDNYDFPINENNYELKKRIFTLKDIETIFKGYELNSFKEISGSLLEFLLKDNNLVMVVEGYYNKIVDNLGVIISKWDLIEEHIEELQLEEIDLIKVQNIISLINFEDNTIGKYIDRDIIKSICDNTHYEILDINKRIDILIDLFKDSFKVVSSTIPLICYKDNEYTIKVIDKYDQEIFRMFDGSLYKVGALGNDFLHYIILNKNGVEVAIYKDDVVIAKVFGIRNGNTLFFNHIEGLKDEHYDVLLREFANKLIEITKNDEDPIEFVTIVNNELYNNENTTILDKTICPIINYPISISYSDYEEFKNNKNILTEEDIIYTNYSDNVTTILASSNIIDKNNFKFYDVEDKYYRKRNNVLKLSNNMGEEYINRIDTILYLYKLIYPDAYVSDLILSDMNEIYLGDDFILFKDKNGEIYEYVLPYDERALNEVKLIKDSLN